MAGFQKSILTTMLEKNLFCMTHDKTFHWQVQQTAERNAMQNAALISVLRFALRQLFSYGTTVM
jgi:hypothetical protein